MILYTMMPYELIFSNENQALENQKVVTYQGVQMLVEFTDPLSFQIVRVLSSDPMHYLDGRFSPGTKISLLNLEGLSLS